MSTINFLDKTGLTHFWSKIKSLFLMTGKRGTAIPSNADLNTYKTPGTYYSADSTVSKTLSNVPLTGSGFTLYVIASYTSTRFIQLAYYTDAQRYIRYVNGSTWTNWYRDYSEKQKPTAADVGLGNVDNTSDLDKPVSTATQAALDSYLPLAGGTMSGPITMGKNSLGYSTGSSGTKIFVLPKYAYTNFDIPAGDHDAYMKAVLAKICVEYPNVVEGIWFGIISPGVRGSAIIHIYNTGEVDSTTGLPRYSDCICTPYSAGGYYCGTQNYEFYRWRIMQTQNISNYALPLTGGTLSGDVTVSKSGEPAKVHVTQTGDNAHSVCLDAAVNGHAGVWDTTYEKWLVRSDENGNIMVPGNADTATKLAAAAKIDGIPFDGSADITHYGTCTTGAGTQTKVVTCAGFTLVTGARIHVRFSNAQTYNGQVKLNVNSTGAINVTQRDTTASVRYEWQGGEVIGFVYDGTNWIIENGGVATTTYYGKTKLSSSITSTAATVAATPAAVNVLREIINDYSMYSASSTYAVGSRVIYGTRAYECNTAITTAEAWNAAHWTELNPLQKQIDDIATVRYHKYLFLGDSYDVIQGDTTVSGTVAECLGLDSSDWVKLSVGGYGFAPQYSGQTASTWISRLQTYVSNHTEDELAKFTDFVMFGGANDTATTEAQMDTAVSEFITYAKQHFVNAKFYLGFTGWTRDPSAHVNYRRTRDLYYSMAEKYGFTYLHNVEYVLHNYDYLMTDAANYHHPTAEGVVRVGKAVAECILSGTCHVRYNENITFTSSVSYGTILGAIISIEDDTTAITFSNLTLNANTSASGLAFGAWSAVGTYSTPLLKSNVSSKIFITANTTKEMGFLLVEFQADGTFRVAQFASNSTPKNQFLLTAQSTADFRFNTMLN